MDADEGKPEGRVGEEEVQSLGGFNSYSQPADPIVQRTLARVQG
jgi:hypothetical protein